MTVTSEDGLNRPAVEFQSPGESWRANLRSPPFLHLPDTTHSGTQPMEIRLSRMVFQVRKIADEAHQLLVINFNRRQLLMEIVVCKPSGYWLAIHCVHLNTLFLFTAILALRYLLMNRFRATKVPVSSLSRKSRRT